MRAHGNSCLRIHYAKQWERNGSRGAAERQSRWNRLMCIEFQRDRSALFHIRVFIDGKSWTFSYSTSRFWSSTVNWFTSANISTQKPQIDDGCAERLMQHIFRWLHTHKIHNFPAESYRVIETLRQLWQVAAIMWHIFISDCIWKQIPGTERIRIPYYVRKSNENADRVCNARSIGTRL